MKTLTAFSILLVANYVVCEQVMYDRKHHKAIIYRPGTGCYEYHMNHQESQDSYDDNLRPALEAEMIASLDCSTDIHEVGHHSIDHLSQEIKTACSAVPVYRFDQTGCVNSTTLPIISGSPVSGNPVSGMP
ncbi:uncharacterized protein LOC130048254 [Ostrea edulis]|uniref:uncharacterized protein LOC130048254 n=1 Tax=Ostrea edulis TaxID=37623 RepID=UPI0024AF5DF3|nr:uncharacterized protein LOC130048254 [Ostrea edulis]